MATKSGKRRAKVAGDECYYQVLNIARDADENAIKKAYKKLAMKWHPDKNRDDPEKATEMFKLVAEAFEVLSDPEKRDIYDRYGKDGLKNGVGSAGFQGFEFDFTDAAHIFESFFGSDPFFQNFGGVSGSPHRRSDNRGRGNFPFGNGGMFSDFGPFGGHMQQMSMFDNFDRGFGGFGNDFFEDGFANFGNFSNTSSYQTMSSSSAGGMSRSVKSSTRMVNGRKVTKTETTIRYPDGHVETTTNEAVDNGRLENSSNGGNKKSRLGWFN